MYLSYSETNITDFTSGNVSRLYNQGYLFTRKSRGNLYQTRSLRIDLQEFQLNSENRRILNKNIQLNLSVEPIPLLNYSWEIHAMGKKFYLDKFGDETFSAQKIKALVTDLNETNMNLLFKYSLEEKSVGYAITYQNENLLHYAYPFYDLEVPREQSLGMGMMLKGILLAQENNKKYVYLGSVAEPASKYKLQFSGLEWWDNDLKSWNKDLESLKTLIGI